MGINTQRGLAPVAVLLIALVIIGAAVVAVRGVRTAFAPNPIVSETSSVATTPSQTVNTTPVTSAVTASSTSTSTLTLDKTTVITYDTTGYSPNEITITKGQTVRFENASGKAFWPASNNHPSHLIYPEFDAKQRIPNLGFYEFTFTKTGTWKYHDHINASKGGTIIVK